MKSHSARADMSGPPSGIVRWMKFIRDAKESHKLKRELPDTLLLLASLLSAGIPMEDAAYYAHRSTRTKLAADYLLKLAHAVREGSPVSSVSPEVLPVWLSVLIQTAERTGDIPAVLTTWSVQAKEERQWLSSLWKKSLYPLILFVGSIVTMSVIGLVALPQFERMYVELGLSVPVFMKTFAALWEHVPLILSLFLLSITSIAAVCIGVAMRYPALWAVVARKLPWHSLIQLHRAYRLSLTLFLLTNAGLPLMDALSHLRVAGGTRWMARAGGLIAERVGAGATLAESFSGDWDPMFDLQMRRAELSGDLADGLGKTKEFTRREFVRRVEMLLQWIEPVLSIAMGLLVGFTMFCLYVPMYTLISSMSSY